MSLGATGTDGDSGQTKDIPLSVGPRPHPSQLGPGPWSVVLRTGKPARKGPESPRTRRIAPRGTAKTRAEEPKLEPELRGKDVTQQQQVGGAVPSLWIVRGYWVG